jgi:hypothetical protein
LPEGDAAFIVFAAEQGFAPFRRNGSSRRKY